jgi:hypothetical protein
MKKYLLTALAVLATSTGLSAQIEAASRRPLNVPAGYGSGPSVISIPLVCRVLPKTMPCCPTGECNTAMEL